MPFHSKFAKKAPSNRLFRIFVACSETLNFMNIIVQKSITVHCRKCTRSRTFRSIFISLKKKKKKKRNLNKNKDIFEQKLMNKLFTRSGNEFEISFLNIFANIFFVLFLVVLLKKIIPAKNTKSY